MHLFLTDVVFLHEPGAGAACFIEALLDEKAAKWHIRALIAVPRNVSERELCTCRSFLPRTPLSS